MAILKTHQSIIFANLNPSKTLLSNIKNQWEKPNEKTKNKPRYQLANKFNPTRNPEHQSHNIKNE
jgi:hypothetical protein